MTIATPTSPSFKDVEPVFVVGSSRSGTTLLQLILNAHPDIAMNGELHFFDQILQLRRQIPDLRESGAVGQLFDQLRRVDAFRYLPGLDEQLRQVRKRMEVNPSPSYELFLRYMLEAPALTQRVSRFGEKTPENIRYLFELRAIFPSAKVVHIVRDPRDVVASLLRMPWASRGVLANAAKWKIDMLFVREFQAAGNPVHELRYEDLLASPEATLRALCSSIDVPWSPAMLDFHLDAAREIKDEPWKGGTTKKLNASAQGRWHNDLSPSAVSLVQFVTEPFLTHYRYTPVPVPLGRRIAMPIYLAADMIRYFRGHSAEHARRSTDASDTIFGEETRLRSKMLDAVLVRRT